MTQSKAPPPAESPTAANPPPDDPLHRQQEEERGRDDPALAQARVKAIRSICRPSKPPDKP